MNPLQHKNTSLSGPAARQRASVLIVVMWVVFGLVSVTLYFAHSMTFELRASDNRVAGLEAEQAIEGARRYLSCVLSNLNQPGTMPDPQSYQCQAVAVGNAKFWLIGRTNVDNLTPTIPAFGLIDEASKLNINSSFVGTNLALLPRMTLELSYNIMAWRSTNTANNNGGAESDTYQRLQPPYLCKNAPFESVGELRLIYDLDMDTLYGEDANLNGILDSNENDGDASAPTDNMDGRLDPGLLEYVTAYSREPANQTNGQARVDITNRAGVTSLRTNLVTLFGTTRADQIIAKALATPTITSPLHFYLASGMTAAEFVQIEGIIRGTNVVGLVNVNTASSAVLACLPGMDVNSATQLAAYRQSNQSSTNNLGTMSWLTQVLDPQVCQQMGPWITGKSYQFMADVAAVGHNGLGFRRTRFVFDTSQGTPIILYREDLSHLGWALGKQVRDQLLRAK
ncbi:MAG: ral secretion pathway protein [Pedosphaera sp.]|nr:ral secretion pathway protein [Pedosphaera sp.]